MKGGTKAGRVKEEDGNETTKRCSDGGPDVCVPHLLVIRND